MKASTYVGVDTFAFTFPVRSFDERGCTANVLNLGTPEEGWLFSRKLDGGGFMRAGMGGVVFVEASLPKRHGMWQSLSLDCVPDAVEDLYREACLWCEPDKRDFGPKKHGAAGARLKRLDLVRDFEGVTAFSPLLDSLSAIRQPGRATVRRYRDSDLNAAETLRVGPKTSWSVTLYDKHKETDGAAPPGSVRYEARLREQFLRSKACHRAVGSYLETVADARPSVLPLLARERWNHSGFGRTVSGIPEVVARINASDLPPRVKRDLFAYVMGRRYGLETAWSRNTASKYRRLARDLDLSLLPEDSDSQFTAALDLDSGTLQVEEG